MNRYDPHFGRPSGTKLFCDVTQSWSDVELDDEQIASPTPTGVLDRCELGAARLEQKGARVRALRQDHRGRP